MSDTLTTVALILLAWFALIIAYDVLFEIVYRRIVRRYRYSVEGFDGFVTNGLVANLADDGSFREKTLTVRLGFVAHWGVPNAFDIMRWFQKAFPEWTIFVPSPPGFGGTTNAVHSFASIARNSMFGVRLEGAREVITTGASMGANIATKEARALIEHSMITRPVLVVSFAGVIEKMEPKELRRRFLHPMGMIDRLGIKWWRRGFPISTRIATRGLIRAALHETLYDIVLRRRMPLANAYQDMLADTELEEDLLFLRKSNVSAFAIFGDRDRLAGEGHKTLWTRHPWVHSVGGQTHLGLCVDGRTQARLTRNLLEQ